FRDYQRPPQMAAADWSSATTFLGAADTFLVTLGSPLAAADIARSRALGVLTVSALLLLWLGAWRFGKRERHAGGGARSLGGGAWGGGAGVGVGRAAHGVATGLESKSVTSSTLAIVAPYLGLACLPRLRGRREVLAGLTAVIGVGWMAANVVGFERARTWRRARDRAAYLLQTIEMQPDENNAAIFLGSQIPDASEFLPAKDPRPFPGAGG